MDPIALAQVATGLSVVGGAVMVMKEMSMMSPSPLRCPSCNGSGQVKCLCSRWSDGDAGCRACGGSVRMTCSSCRGTGTARPISVRLSANRNPN